MTTSNELIYATTNHRIAVSSGIEDTAYARALHKGSEARQEQLVRVATAVREQNSKHIEHRIMHVGDVDVMADLYQDVFDLQGFDLSEDLTFSKVGRKALAVANLYVGSYDQDGFELRIIEPFHNANVLDLFDAYSEKLDDPDFFFRRVRVRD